MNQIDEEQEWTVRYYTEMNSEKRQMLLYENFTDPKTEADLFREKLWVARYGKRKPKNDAFVGYLMNLKYIAESGSVDIGGKKKEACSGSDSWTESV